MPYLVGPKPKNGHGVGSRASGGCGSRKSRFCEQEEKCGETWRASATGAKGPKQPTYRLDDTSRRRDGAVARRELKWWGRWGLPGGWSVERDLGVLGWAGQGEEEEKTARVKDQCQELHQLCRSRGPRKTFPPSARRTPHKRPSGAVKRRGRGGSFSHEPAEPVGLTPHKHQGPCVRGRRRCGCGGGSAPPLGAQGALPHLHRVGLLLPTTGGRGTAPVPTPPPHTHTSLT